MTKRQNQCYKVMQYIDNHGSISNAEAMSLRVGRLASRVFDLRQAGYPIVSNNATSKDSDGFVTHYARYSIGGI